MNKILNTISTTFPRLNSDDDYERILAILLPEEPLNPDVWGDVEPPEATLEMIMCYYNFLVLKLPVGLRLTGREDMGYFGWEENFLCGAEDATEYNRLKKDRASCQDKFLFLKLNEYDEKVGVFAEVKRIGDNKFFTIPLMDLAASTQKSKQYQLIEDYALWFVNFCND